MKKEEELSSSEALPSFIPLSLSLSLSRFGQDTLREKRVLGEKKGGKIGNIEGRSSGLCRPHGSSSVLLCSGRETAKQKTPRCEQVLTSKCNAAQLPLLLLHPSLSRSTLFSFLPPSLLSFRLPCAPQKGLKPWGVLHPSPSLCLKMHDTGWSRVEQSGASPPRL